MKQGDLKMRNLLIPILLSVISTSGMAEADLSGIEAEERAQIISELTYRLDTKQNCDQTLNWDDSGSGADLDGYFFIPNAKDSEYIIGGHASGKKTSDYHCTTTVSVAADNPKARPPLLATPANWKQVWKDSGSGAAKDGSFWKALPPDDNYVCIGSVSQLNHNAKPNIPNYRCVHKSLTDKIVASAIVWSDKGTGADQRVSVFSLPATGAFIAVSSRANSIEAYDLKKNGTSVPDPKMVEEILAKRLAPLKADIEAKTLAMQEQKQAVKKETAKKEVAEKEVATKEAAPKKIVEEKATVAKVETKQKDNTEAEAQKLKEQQQARIAKAMEEKAATEKAKQKLAMAKQAEAEKSKKEEAKPEPAKTESKSEAEAPAQIKAEEIETVDTNVESHKTSETKSESKGLNDIMMFFLKIFGMMVGGVIVFMIAFKVIFGKKK